MENESQYNYKALHMHAVDEDDAEFLEEAINSFTDMGARLHSVVPKTENGTTTGYIVILEFKK